MMHMIYMPHCAYQAHFLCMKNMMHKVTSNLKHYIKHLVFVSNILNKPALNCVRLIRFSRLEMIFRLEKRKE